jgi:glycosyltransferase involved in cell wall biosynthesis
LTRGARLRYSDHRSGTRIEDLRKFQRARRRAQNRLIAGNPLPRRPRFHPQSDRSADYPAELERLAPSVGLRDRTVFTGHTNEVASWMAAADVVVNASEPEPFGLVVVEAMASGCAVVALSKGGPRDVIEHGQTGLLCPSREPRVLAEAIVSLVNSDELRARLGHAARVRVQSQFTREAMASRFSGILRNTVEAV